MTGLVGVPAIFGLLMTSELLREFTSSRLRRAFVFVAFREEETGLLGSKAMARNRCANKFGVFVTLAGAYEKTDIVGEPGFTSQFHGMPGTGSPSRRVYESAISP